MANRFADSRLRRWRVVRGAAESAWGGVDVKRRIRQAGLGIERVVAAGRDVVGRVWMKQRGQELDVPAADAELVLTATVGAHPALLAELVGLEEAANRAEARRLEIDRARDHLARQDVLDAVDRGVPRDPVLERR